MCTTTGKETKRSCRLPADGVPVVTLCNINYSPEGIYHPDRVMDEYDLVYTLSGGWDIWEEDVCYAARPGNVLLLEPGKHHFSREKCTPQMRNMFIHFKFSGEKSGQEAGELALAKLTDCSRNRNVLRYFQEIIEMYWSGSRNRDVKLAYLLKLLLLELSDIFEERDMPADILITAVIRRFYLTRERFLSPAELALDYGLSQQTLSSRFKKATGQTIHQYQLNLKLGMAYDILPLNPGRGLRDIALSFGFYDEFQFSRLFKRKFGISPSQRRMR